jgi:hypothetical protein
MFYLQTQAEMLVYRRTTVEEVWGDLEDGDEEEQEEEQQEEEEEGEVAGSSSEDFEVRIDNPEGPDLLAEPDASMNLSLDEPDLAEPEPDLVEPEPDLLVADTLGEPVDTLGPWDPETLEPWD